MFVGRPHDRNRERTGAKARAFSQISLTAASLQGLDRQVGCRSGKTHHFALDLEALFALPKQTIESHFVFNVLEEVALVRSPPSEPVLKLSPLLHQRPQLILVGLKKSSVRLPRT